jgi:hypothetical protein
MRETQINPFHQTPPAGTYILLRYLVTNKQITWNMFSSYKHANSQTNSEQLHKQCNLKFKESFITPNPFHYSVYIPYKLTHKLASTYNEVGIACSFM